MMDHLSKRTEDEFKMPNMLVVSDDEEAIAESIRQVNAENHRMYNKYDLQMDIKSDCEIMPIRREIPKYTGGPPQQYQQQQSAPREENVMKWLLKECGLNDDIYKKLEEQQINQFNIAYLS